MYVCCVPLFGREFVLPHVVVDTEETFSICMSGAFDEFEGEAVLPWCLAIGQGLNEGVQFSSSEGRIQSVVICYVVVWLVA